MGCQRNEAGSHGKGLKKKEYQRATSHIAKVCLRPALPPEQGQGTSPYLCLFVVVVVVDTITMFPIPSLLFSTQPPNPSLHHIVVCTHGICTYAYMFFG